MGQGSSNPLSSQQTDEDKAGWMCRLGARVLGIIAGILCLALGLWALITFSATCLAAGMIQMVIGFAVIALEAPCCCMWFDFIERIGQFSESRPNWQKAFLYGFLGVIPLIMCPEIATVFGGGMVFVTGAFYGMMALGKKADRSTMMARAEPQQATDAWDVNLVDKQKDPNDIP